ncbi:MAG: hypothetical protein WCX71_04060 [Candidatus Buchananbacteria bacterium]
MAWGNQSSNQAGQCPICRVPMTMKLVQVSSVGFGSTTKEQNEPVCTNPKCVRNTLGK